MLAAAVVISLNWLGWWWMLPPEALTDVTGINNCIRQCGDVQPGPAPAVLQPSAAKACALYKVRV
jgi:hypothetical protein